MQPTVGHPLPAQHGAEGGGGSQEGKWPEATLQYHYSYLMTWTADVNAIRH